MKKQIDSNKLLDNFSLSTTMKLEKTILNGDTSVLIKRKFKPYRGENVAFTLKFSVIITLTTNVIHRSQYFFQKQAGDQIESIHNRKKVQVDSEITEFTTLLKSEEDFIKDGIIQSKEFLYSVEYDISNV